MPAVTLFCLKWPIRLWPSCPKTYLECLSWFIKLNYSLWVFYPAFCFSRNVCNFNSSNIVLMDLGLNIIIMLEKAFLSRPWKLYEFSTGSVCINSRPTKRSTDLAIVLHINLKNFEMCKTRISSRQRLVGLELMRVELSLYFYSFSDVVVGKENWDQSLDGGGNTLPNGYVSRGEWMLSWVWLEITKC